MLFFLTALLVATADQLTKVWIRSYSEGQVIFKAGFFSIIHTNNSGAAFGILQDQSFLLTIAGFTGILLILLFTFIISRHSPFLGTKAGKLALGLVLGGTIGNLTDRLRYGHVTDFISVSIWPTFNIADSAVS
ncbi:MAG: signal peptidase II, partial [Chloroflexota bacterium]